MSIFDQIFNTAKEVVYDPISDLTSGKDAAINEKNVATSLTTGGGVVRGTAGLGSIAIGSSFTNPDANPSMPVTQPDAGTSEATIQPPENVNSPTTPTLDAQSGGQEYNSNYLPSKEDITTGVEPGDDSNIKNETKIDEATPEGEKGPVKTKSEEELSRDRAKKIQDTFKNTTKALVGDGQKKAPVAKIETPVIKPAEPPQFASANIANSNSIFDTIFGDDKTLSQTSDSSMFMKDPTDLKANPKLSDISKIPAIQPKPLVSDKNLKINIKLADRSVKEFLNQIYRNT